ncbi:pentatricopeptide repeat protein [Aspergillus affinis]|uniref:pentatricopeptide repeat protein n=1 Tax=Aspergillus affinis TaxID=1070780 RepID=UPI0022FDBE77|nr:pentatricopeptide repeat protein [Aspergillus affinis]KAI9039485.1 pentatricopeptide repeat protein [Aspergillus affinis]
MYFNVEARGQVVNGVSMVPTGYLPEEGPRYLPLAPGVVEQENKQREKNLYFRKGDDFRKWKSDYAEIWAVSIEGHSPDNLSSECLELDQASYKLFESLTLDGPDSFRLAWERLTKEEKSDHWPRMSLYLLYCAPDLAWQFLYVTCQNEDRPVFMMVWYCLDFLRVRCSEEVMRQGVRGITFENLIQTVLNPEFWPIIFPPQRGMRLFIKHSTREDLERAYNLVLERKNNVRPETWMGFMWRFTHYGDIENALGALSQLPKLQRQGYLLDHTMVQYHCCKLLLQDYVCDGPDGRNFYILPKLLQMGVLPSRDMMNVVLSNAFKTGDSRLGQDMLEYMKSAKHEFDQFTYLTLLRDAVDRGDEMRVEELTEEIRLRPEVYKNPLIASKLLHARYVFTVKNPDANVSPSEVFLALLDMYNELYDLTPLKDLTILPPHYTPETPGENNPPSVVALFLIVASYIRCQKQLPVVVRIYTKYRSLAWQGHPTIAPMQAFPHIYNEFLAAYRQSPRGIRPAVRLVEDMLRGSEEAPQSAAPGGEAITPCKPTIWTWNILLSIFLFNRQPYAMERVREMMGNHNVEYDQVTWNTIIRAQVKTQNVMEVAQSIKSMEKQGFGFNDRTMKALGFLHDPHRLWMAVKELDNDFEPPIDQLYPDLHDFATGKAREDEAREIEAREDGAKEDAVKEDENEDEGLLVQGLQRLIKTP